MTTPSEPTSAVRSEPPKACPICQGEIERGSLSVHGTLLGFLFAGWSYQHCWFKGRGKNEEQVVLRSGERTSGFRCVACGFVGIYRPGPSLFSWEA